MAWKIGLQGERLQARQYQTANEARLTAQALGWKRYRLVRLDVNGNVMHERVVSS